LTCSYILFAVPYFVYDIYAMFMCYWYKLRVKGHEEAATAPKHMGSALLSYLRREFLMVLHHVVMVTVCFPVSVVTSAFCLLEENHALDAVNGNTFNSEHDFILMKVIFIFPKVRQLVGLLLSLMSLDIIH
jgi:hypothetical protein